jgi:hypothetical protein
VKWDDTVKVTDVAIVVAAILGPILAVQAQVFLDRRRALRGRRLNIFHALMRTRATPIAPDAVNALNAVPLEFYGVPRITGAYGTFIAHITTPQANNPEGWGNRRADLLFDLIHKIATEVGYKFDVAQLKAEFYAPQGHQTLENEQTAIRQGLAKLLSGEGALPMEVKRFPGDPEAQAAFKAVLKGETAIKVKSEEATPERRPPYGVPPPRDRER